MDNIEFEHVVCPEYESVMEKIFKINEDRLIKMFAIRKETAMCTDFKDFFNKLIKSRLDFALQVHDPNSEGKARYKESTRLFEKLFGGSQVLVDIVQRDNILPVIQNLFDQLRDVENINIDNDIVNGELKTVVTCQTHEHHSTAKLAKVIKMYFNQLCVKKFSLKMNVSNTTKIHFSKLLERFLKANGITGVDYKGNPSDEFNFLEMGINIVIEPISGTKDIKVCVEFAMDNNNQRYNCQHIKRCLKTFTEEFAYETVENYDVKTKRQIDRDTLRVYNGALLPGAPFEMHPIRVGSENKIEIYGMLPFLCYFPNPLI